MVFESFELSWYKIWMIYHILSLIDWLAGFWSLQEQDRVFEVCAQLYKLQYSLLPNHPIKDACQPLDLKFNV